MPTCPPTEAMLMITPLPRSSMSGRVARVVRNGPVRLTDRTRFQSSSLVSSTVAARPMPATFTSACGEPTRTAISRAADADGERIDQVDGERVGLAARLLDLSAHLFEACGVEVHHRDLVAFTGQVQGDGTPDTGGGAGDHGGLCVELTVRGLSFGSGVRTAGERGGRRRAHITAPIRHGTNSSVPKPSASDLLGCPRPCRQRLESGFRAGLLGAGTSPGRRRSRCRRACAGTGRSSC